MACCQVNRCCCCIEHSIGVRAMALWLTMIEIACIVTSAQIVPEYVYFLVPIFSVGIICHILLFISVHRQSRWFMLPWLIYDMLMIVGLSLVAVLLVVIPLGSYHVDHNWLFIAIKSGMCLAIAGLFLYFWIVVLELFIKLGPVILMEPNPNFYGQMYPQMYPIYQQPPLQQQPMYHAHYGQERPL